MDRVRQFVGEFTTNYGPGPEDLRPALFAAKGYAAPAAERAYTRARELCERLGDPPKAFSRRVGLWANALAARRVTEGR
jgi:hypothetical protein